MAGEEQYYHPIIQAMIANAQNRRDIEHEKNLVAQHQSEMKLRDRAQAEIEKQHEFERGLQEKQFNLMQAMQDVQRHLEQQNLLGKYAEGFRTGTFTPEAFQKPQNIVPGMPAISEGGTAPGTIDLPGVGNLPISAFQNPAQYYEMLAKGGATVAGATEKAKSEAVLPGQLQLEREKGETEKQIEQMRAGAQMAFHSSDKDMQMKIAQLNRDSQERIAAAHNATIIKAAQLGKLGNPDDLKTGIIDFATGGKDFKGNDPFSRAVDTGAHQAGFVRITPKDIEAFKSASNLENGFQQYQNFINTFLPDEAQGALGAKAKALVTGVLQEHTNFPTDAKAAFETASGNVLNFGKALEDNSGGRVNMVQLGLDKNSLPKLTDTKQTAQQKLDAIRTKYISKMKNYIGAAPPDQIDMIEKMQGITVPTALKVNNSNTPDWLKNAPKKNAVGHTLDEQESLKRGTPVYAAN